MPFPSLLQMVSLIAIASIHVYGRHTRIPKYNLFKLHNVTCVYVFTADCLKLGNQLLCFCLTCTGLHTSRFPQLPVVLRIEFRPYRLFSIQFRMVIGVILVQLTFAQSHWRDLNGIASDRRRHDLTEIILSSGNIGRIFMFNGKNVQCFLSLRCASILQMYPVQPYLLTLRCFLFHIIIHIVFFLKKEKLSLPSWIFAFKDGGIVKMEAEQKKI